MRVALAFWSAAVLCRFYTPGLLEADNQPKGGLADTPWGTQIFLSLNQRKRQGAAALQNVAHTRAQQTRNTLSNFPGRKRMPHVYLI